MALRIFIEAKPTFGHGNSTWAHTYLVLREDGVERESAADELSRWIGGQPAGPGPLGNIETAEGQFGGSKDWYGSSSGNSTAAQRTYLDITETVVAKFGGSVESAWAAMAEFANDLHLQYDYEIATWTGTHVASCNAVIFSVLNSIGIDARDYFTSATLNVTGQFSSFPGGDGEVSSDWTNFPTLLGDGSGTITASQNLTAGVALLGSDDRNDILIGTKFVDAYYGEQGEFTSYSATYDTVSFERAAYDLGLNGGLTISIKQENISWIPGVTEPVGIYGVNADASKPDLLFGIEKVLLTEQEDTVAFHEVSSSFQSKIKIDGGAGADILDFSDYVGHVFLGNARGSQSGPGVLELYSDPWFRSGDKLRFENFEEIRLSNNDDVVYANVPGVLIRTGDGADKVWVSNGVGIADLSTQDRVELFGWDLFGGLRYKWSDSQYAKSWGGLAERGLNTVGELVIRVPWLKSTVIEDGITATPYPLQRMPAATTIRLWRALLASSFRAIRIT